MNPPVASLNAAPDIGTGFGAIFHLVGQIVFGWFPATVMVLANTSNPPAGVGFSAVQAGGPATAQDAANYIHITADPGVYAALVHDWEVWTALSLFISLLLMALLVYCVIRILQIRQHENEKWEIAQQVPETQTVSKSLMRWQRIVDEVGSESEQNWRLAILEADIMLGDLLDSLGYKGDTMADKMRGISTEHFNTIDMAWEAHRARNKIAHEGLKEPLSSRDALRIIGLYERVFREFKFLE